LLDLVQYCAPSPERDYFTALGLVLVLELLISCLGRIILLVPSSYPPWPEFEKAGFLLELRRLSLDLKERSTRALLSYRGVPPGGSSSLPPSRILYVTSGLLLPDTDGGYFNSLPLLSTAEPPLRIGVLSGGNSSSQ